MAPVAIVGAGMMGVSLAWWLTRHGLKPLVLERHMPASAASGRNGGLVVAGAHGEYVELAAQLGPSAAEELIRGTVENQALIHRFLGEQGLGKAWVEGGFLALWGSEVERQVFAASAPKMKELGWPMELLPRDACERLLGTRLGNYLAGGAYTPRDGLIQPVTYVLALGRAAHRQGAQFAYPTEVLALARQHGHWRLETSSGPLVAEHVVLAANQQTPVLLPGLKAWLRYVHDTVALTEPAEIRMQAGWAEHSVAPYGRQVEDGGLLVGGFASRRPAPLSGQARPLLGEVQHQLSTYFAQGLPECRHLRVVDAWIGTMVSTPDHLPLAGPWPLAQGLWLLTAFGGQGIPFSQWLPRELAGAIAGCSRARLPAYFAPARFLS